MVSTAIVGWWDLLLNMVLMLCNPIPIRVGIWQADSSQSTQVGATDSVYYRVVRLDSIVESRLQSTDLTAESKNPSRLTHFCQP